MSHIRPGDVRRALRIIESGRTVFGPPKNAWDLWERAGGMCEIKLSEECQIRAVDVHHIKQQSHGGSSSLINIIATCRVCHKKIHSVKDMWPGAPFRTFWFQPEGKREVEWKCWGTFDETEAVEQIRQGKAILQKGFGGKWFLLATRGLGWIRVFYKNGEVKRWEK